MSNIQFSLKEIPHAPNEDATGYYPVVAESQKVTARTLYSTIEKRCTASESDIKLVLSALADVLAERLAEGATIEIPEIGFFAPAVSSDAAITDPADKQLARHLRISGIRFRPKKALVQQLQNVSFRRAETVIDSTAGLTDEELHRRIRTFMAGQSVPILTRADLERITGYRHTKAVLTLRRLTESGFLVRNGKPRSPYYTLA